MRLGEDIIYSYVKPCDAFISLFFFNLGSLSGTKSWLNYRGLVVSKKIWDSKAVLQWLMIKQKSHGLDKRFSTAFTFPLLLGFFHSWETCPKSRLATVRAEKAPKDLEDEGLAPGLLKETTGEKQGLFPRTDWWREIFCVGRSFWLLFYFLFVICFTDLKKCWIFPASPPSPSSFLQYSWIFCAALPFHFAVGCHVQRKLKRTEMQSMDLLGFDSCPSCIIRKKFSA